MIKSRIGTKATASAIWANGLPSMPRCHIHDLRAIYASAVYTMYDCPHSLAYTTMRVLCHDHIEESLSYGHVRLLNVGELAGSLGALDGFDADPDGAQ